MVRSSLASAVAATFCLASTAPALSAEQRVAAQATPVSSGTAVGDTKRDEKLRAAAEPFEKLTEIAFAATSPAIERAMVEAEAAGRRVRILLPRDAAIRLDEQVAAMRSAGRKRDHARLALSSIEAYRVLVSAVAGDARVPTEVSLLDYAGFRYDADLKASPARWADMTQAVSFARDNWAKLSPRAKAFPQATAFEGTLADMEKAAIQRNATSAASSVKAELDLVDQLETFFSKP